MMTNVERPSIQPFRLFVEQMKEKRQEIIRAVLFLISSFFLAQSILFEAAIPFFLPMWAFVYLYDRRYSLYVLIGGVAGSLFLGVGQVVIHALQLLLLHGLMHFRITRNMMPFAVSSSILLVQLAWQFMMHGLTIPIEVLFFISFEVILSLFMTFFLLYAFDRPTATPWTLERLSAASVVIVMAVTGLSGLIIGYVDIAVVLIYLFLLCVAFIGGVSAATIVGMVISIVIGLSQLSFTGMIALYSVTGFVAGMFKGLGRLGIAIGTIGITCFFFLYDATLPLDHIYFISIAVAISCFLLLPRHRLEKIQRILKREPIEPIERKRQQWIENRLTEKLGSFQQFSQFLSAMMLGRYEDKHEKIPHFVPLACEGCFKYEKCWADPEGEMETLTQEWMQAFVGKQLSAQQSAEERLKYKCIRSTRLMNTLETEGVERMLYQQVQHGRQILALQLRDMSQHLDEVMDDIQGNLSTSHPSEEELMKLFHRQGIECYQIDILKEEVGNKQIVCCLAEKKAGFERDETVAEKLIIPVLESYYREPFQVKKAMFHVKPFRHVQVTLQSAVRFSFDYGVTMLSSSPSLRSGDAYEVFSLHEGLSVVLLSDGMGQDVKAYHESRKVIQLMRECLHQKMSPETAMHTLYYMMSLNGLEDMYATLDLALVDLQKGKLWSWKAGSMSTYVLRGEQLIRIDSEDAPVGIVPSPTIEAKEHTLKAGDLVVMLTDGVFHPGVSLELQERTLYNIVKKSKEASCEEITERIMEQLAETYRTSGDDRTVLVMKIDHALPNWAGFSPLELKA